MLERPILRTSLRNLQQPRRILSPASSRSIHTCCNQCTRTLPQRQALATRRYLSTTISRSIQATKPRHEQQPTEPTPLTDDEYHDHSDAYFEVLLEKLEELQEDRGDMDVEYSQGVMTIVLPPHGTYVLNKQPPNKQIWLSAPVSGPKRYDWVVKGNTAETQRGEWVYLRDGSTLTALVREEWGIDVGGRGDV